MAYTTTATSTGVYGNWTTSNFSPPSNKIELTEECIDKIADAVVEKLEKQNRLLKDENPNKPTCVGCKHLVECHYTLKDVPWDDCNWKIKGAMIPNSK